MPRVPVYDRQVSEAPLPAAQVNLRVTPEDFGAGVAQGAEQLGAGLAKVAQAEEKRHREARLMDVYSKLGEQRLELETAASGIRGETALEQDVPGIARQRLKETFDGLVSGMPEDLQLQARQIYLREDEGLHRSALRHVEGEQQALVTDTRKAAVAVAMKKAERSAGDPLAFNAARQEGLMALELGGAPAEADKLAFLDHLDKLSLDGGARAKAVELEAKHKGNLKAAIVEAQAFGDVKLADATVARLQQRNADVDKGQADYDKQALGRIFTRIEQTGGAYSFVTDQDYDRLSDWAKGQANEKLGATRRHRQSMGVEDRRAQAEARRLQQEADRLAESDFDARVQNELEGAAGLDVRMQYPGASPTAVNTILAKQGRARKEWDKDRGVSAKQFDERVDAVAQSLGYDPKTTAKQFRTYLRDQRSQWLSDNPTKEVPPEDVVRKMLGDAILYGNPGRLSRNRPAWQLQQSGSTFSPIPEVEQPEKVKAARAKLGGASPAPAAPARVASDADYAALPSGAQFIGPDGKLRRKP